MGCSGCVASMRRYFLAWLALAAGLPTLGSAQPCTPPVNHPKGVISSSIDLIRATTDDTKLGGTGRVVLWSGASLCPQAQLRRLRSLVTVGADYREKEASDGRLSITRSYRLDAAQAIVLSNRVFTDVAAQLFHNNSLGVELQQVYRATVGVVVGSFEFGAGPAYVDQDFGTAGESATFWSASIHETAGLASSFPVAGTQLTQSIRLLLPFDQPDAQQLNAAANAIVPITASFGISWSLWYAYLENAPTGREKSYTSTSLGITWEF
jgi:hypothetical protein